MRVNVKKLHPNAVIPTYAKAGDAGMDLTAVSKIYDKHGNASYGIGLAFEIPHGYMGLIFPRSSVTKQELSLANSIGVIDSGYRGEVFVKFKPTPFFVSHYPEDDSFEFITQSTTEVTDYQIGDRVAQIIIMPYPYITFMQVDDLSSTERGEGGFGSTGIK